MALAISAEAATAAWVVMAPMVTVVGVTVMPVKPSLARSTTTLGLLRRCFSTGMKVWPPARAFASMSPPKVATADAISAGFS